MFNYIFSQIKKSYDEQFSNYFYKKDVNMVLIIYSDLALIHVVFMFMRFLRIGPNMLALHYYEFQLVRSVGAQEKVMVRQGGK